MDIRAALYDLAHAHGLDSEQTKQLIALTRSSTLPKHVVRRLASLLAVVAGALLGVAAVYVVAANWAAIGRFGRFGFLQVLIILCAAGSFARPSARLPLGVVSFLAIGALLTCLGISYPTGADPWQLFAWWCGLTLPMCIGLRADLFWIAWTTTAMTTIWLWAHAGAGPGWQIAAWCLALGLVFGLSPLLARYTGAGRRAYRSAMLMFLLIVVKPGLHALFASFDSAETIFGAACLLIGFAGLTCSRRGLFDLFNLTIVALALNVLASAYFFSALIEASSDTALAVSLFVLRSAAMMGGSIILLRHLSKVSPPEAEHA